MVNILGKPEQILRSRFGRRGFSLEECRKVLDNKKGDVTFVQKRSFRQSDLGDAAKYINC